MESVTGKLVRDKIPEIIKEQGKNPQTRRLKGDEYLDALKEKIVEEGREVRLAESIPEIMEELADIQEVTDTLLRLIGRTREELGAVQDEKRNRNGGFENRIIIDRLE